MAKHGSGRPVLLPEPRFFLLPEFRLDPAQFTDRGREHFRTLALLHSKLANSQDHSDVLTPEQSELRYHFVRHRHEWEGHKMDADSSVRNYGAVSFDMESRSNVKIEDPKKQMRGSHVPAYALFGTFEGTAFVFDLYAFTVSSGLEWDPDRPLQGLPQTVQGWLRDPSIVVMGTNIRGDVRTTCFDIRAWLDTRLLFRHYVDRKVGVIRLANLPGVDQPGFADGLGIQAFYAKNLDHKPNHPHKYAARYGRPMYEERHGQASSGGRRLAWPSWRTHRLYTWNDLAPDDHHHWYLFHDATTPVSLVTRILLDQTVLRGAGVLNQAPDLHSLIQSVVGPFVERPAEPDPGEGTSKSRRRKNRRASTPLLDEARVELSSSLSTSDSEPDDPVVDIRGSRLSQGTGPTSTWRPSEVSLVQDARSIAEQRADAQASRRAYKEARRAARTPTGREEVPQLVVTASAGPGASQGQSSGRGPGTATRSVYVRQAGKDGRAPYAKREVPAPRSARGPTTGDKRGRSEVPPTGPDSPLSCASTASVDGDTDEEPQSKRHRDGDSSFEEPAPFGSVRRRPKADLSRRSRKLRVPKWMSKEKRLNPFLVQPSFGAHCDYCGSMRDARFYEGGEIACPKLLKHLETKREKDRRCDYAFCKTPSDHYTKVCPALHQRCRRCLARGHDFWDGCTEWDEGEWDRRREAWIDAAPKGVFTYQHQTVDYWSYYPAKFGDPFPFAIAPASLNKMPTTEAFAQLDRSRRSPELFPRPSGLP